MLFSHRYRYFFILLLALYAYMNTALCDVYFHFGIRISWYDALLTIVAITLFTWEGNRLLRSRLRDRFSRSRNNIRSLGLFFIAGNIVAVVSAFLAVYIMGFVIYDYNWQQNENPLKLNIIYATLINLFLHLVNSILFYFNEYRQKWEEAEELRRSGEQAKLQVIRSQVNPHFLFNNLNVLSGMLIKDNPEANLFIEEFSKVYRYILSNQDKELVKLDSELEFIQPYLFLLRKRFDTGLQVTMHIDDRYRGWHVVPAALQMLIENAIKHNIVSRQRPLHIDIHTNGDQTLVVKNNLQPRKVQEASTRIGLQNIRRRYELISGKDVMVQKTEKEFQVTLPLLNLN